MKLLRLEIHRLPGIHRGFTVDGFDGQLNVITGPNASGKSSLLRALRYLLVPPAKVDPGDLVLGACLVDGDVEWTVERTAGSVSWKRNGSACPAPGLPDADALQSYLLQVDSLLHATSSDRTLMERFRRELVGGFDLDRLAGDGGPFEVRRGRDQAAARELQSATSELRDARRGNAQLVELRQRLPLLREHIAEAGTANRVETQCRDALAVLEAQRGRREAAARLEQFPRPMPEGLDEEQVLSLERELDAIRRSRADASRTLDEATATLRRQGLAESPHELPEIDLRAPREWLARLDQEEERQRQLGEQEQRQRARAREAGQVLGERAAGEHHLPHALLGELEQAALRLQHAEREHAALQARIRAATAGRNGNRRTRLTDVVALALIGGGGALLAPAVWSAQDGVGAIGLLLQLSGVLLAVRRFLARASTAADDPDLQEQLRQAGQQQQEAEAALSAMADRAGLEMETSGLPWHFQLLAQRLVARDEAMRELEEARAAVAASAARRQDWTSRLTEFLRQFGNPPDQPDGSTLRAALNHLEQRLQASERAGRDAAEAQRTADTAAEGEMLLEGRLRQLYERAGLEPGDRETLLSRIRQLPDWASARGTLRDAEVREQTARDRLEHPDPDLRHWLECGDEAAIEQRRSEAAKQSAQLDGLRAEEADIRAAIDAAERAHRLEQCRARRDTARERLAERRHRRLLAEAGLLLLEEVSAEYRELHQPAALREADQAFRQFTQYAFSLELDTDGRPGARAVESNHLHNLETLSIGTRMQLLIALRVAWLRQQETTTPVLPLFLDEALTTSDPVRFEAVAAALHTAARTDGRQIFYLTAQPEDVQRWEHATGTRPTHIDLARVRRLGQAATAPLALPSREPIPAPEGETPAAYARRLQVPPILPREDAGQLHLFHLLRDDLDLLHGLLATYRVESLGQLETLLETPLGRQLASHRNHPGLKNRMRAARAWFDAWRIGRGRPVDRVVLEQSPAGGWQTLDALAQRAETTGDEAETFLQSLETRRIPNVGPKKIEQLRAWLQEQAYLDPRPPLDRDERYRRVLQVVGETALPDIRELVDWLEVGHGISADNEETPEHV